jgi:hypothetical protein
MHGAPDFATPASGVRSASLLHHSARARTMAFYAGQLNITGDLHDTYISTRRAARGIVWVNGNNLGRYWESKGPQVCGGLSMKSCARVSKRHNKALTYVLIHLPQHALYVPAGYLRLGRNDITVLELAQETAGQSMRLSTRRKPDLH